VTTIKDVATLAAVSIATVSRVLNGNSNVSEETRARVLDAIRKLNYQPNALARNLRRSETRTITAIFPDLANTFFSRIIKGMEKVADERGFNILIGDTNNDPVKEMKFINLLRERRTDGIIFTTARVDSRHIIEISDKAPVVLACEYFPNIDIPSVGIDNVRAAYNATNYLIELGHKRIAHIGGPVNVILSHDRLKGYCMALEHNRIQVDETLIRTGTFYFDSGYEAMLSLLDVERRPTAVFAASDEMAIGAIKAIKEKGLRVPDDISVVGFDDIALAELVDLPLTTISQPVYKIGTTAMEMLTDLVAGRCLAHRQIILEAKLVIRRSTAPLGI
jgi:LacI family repressor for deo operon, udp, cdd, tsx, nupC, and nupG